jgi:hypothetical protein
MNCLHNRKGVGNVLEIRNFDRKEKVGANPGTVESGGQRRRRKKIQKIRSP